MSQRIIEQEEKRGDGDEDGEDVFNDDEDEDEDEDEDQEEDEDELENEEEEEEEDHWDAEEGDEEKADEDRMLIVPSRIDDTSRERNWAPPSWGDFYSFDLSPDMSGRIRRQLQHQAQPPLQVEDTEESDFIDDEADEEGLRIPMRFVQAAPVSTRAMGNDELGPSAVNNMIHHIQEEDIDESHAAVLGALRNNLARGGGEVHIPLQSTLRQLLGMGTTNVAARDLRNHAAGGSVPQSRGTFIDGSQISTTAQPLSGDTNRDSASTGPAAADLLPRGEQLLPGGIEYALRVRPAPQHPMLTDDVHSLLQSMMSSDRSMSMAPPNELLPHVIRRSLFGPPPGLDAPHSVYAPTVGAGTEAFPTLNNWMQIARDRERPQERARDRQRPQTATASTATAPFGLDATPPLIVSDPDDRSLNFRNMVALVSSLTDERTMMMDSDLLDHLVHELSTSTSRRIERQEDIDTMVPYPYPYPRLPSREGGLLPSRRGRVDRHDPRNRERGEASAFQNVSDAPAQSYVAQADGPGLHAGRLYPAISQLFLLTLIDSGIVEIVAQPPQPADSVSASARQPDQEDSYFTDGRLEQGTSSTQSDAPNSVGNTTNVPNDNQATEEANNLEVSSGVGDEVAATTSGDRLQGRDEMEGEISPSSITPEDFQIPREQQGNAFDIFGYPTSSETATAVTVAASSAASSSASNDVPEVGAASGPEVLACPPGYDEEVFHSLPDFMQREVIEEHEQRQSDLENNNRMTELAVAAGFDPETLAALPPSIRQEILEQAQRDLNMSSQQGLGDHGASSSAGETQQSDGISFVDALSPELRVEVLVTAEDDFLASLPQSVQEEAAVYRERAAAQYQQREMEAAAERENLSDDAAVRRVEGETGDRMGRSSDGSSSLQRDVISRIVSTGTIEIGADDVENPTVPLSFIGVWRRLMCEASYPVSARLLQRLMNNFTKHPIHRDYALRSLLALLCGYPAPAAVSCEQRLNYVWIWPELRDAMLSLTSSSHQLQEQISASSSSTALTRLSTVGSLARPLDCKLPLPLGLELRRLLATLMLMSTTNPSVLYCMLQPRAEPFGEVVETEMDSTDMQSRYMNDSTSSNSLLEMLLKRLYQQSFLGSTNEINHLVRLIDILSVPLESFGNVANLTTSPPARGTLVKVPAVIMSREALSGLCEILLSEICSGPILPVLSAVLSRLSLLKANCIPLLETMVDMVGDLALQSKTKLRGLCGQLSPKVVSDHSPSVEVIGRTTGWAALTETNGKQHERLKLAMNTLYDLAGKSNKSFLDLIARIEELRDMWSALDTALTIIDAHLGTDNRNRSKRPSQTLSSVLLRLLPIVECFFLVHVNNLLTDAAPADANEAKTATANSESKASSSQPSPAIPGAKYRTTAAYNSLNVNLYGASTDEGREAESAGLPALPRARSLHRSSSRSGSTSDITLASGAQRLVAFVLQHEISLNVLVHMRPALLDGAFAGLVRIIQLRPHLDFDNKRHFFLEQLRKRSTRWTRPRRNMNLQVRRDRVFEDSFQQLRSKDREDLRGKIVINFVGEDGVDAGGLTREWFVLLSREIFNPNYALFTAAADGATFQPNPISYINTNHLDYFKFVGRVIGKAVVDGQLMDAHFTRYDILPLYLRLLFPVAVLFPTPVLMHFLHVVTHEMHLMYVGPSTSIYWECQWTSRTSKRQSRSTTAL